MNGDNRTMAKRRYGVRTNVFGIFAGLVCGLLLASWCKRSLLPCGPNGTGCCDQNVLQNAYENKDSQVNEGIDISTLEADVKKKDNFLFIGVMTAQKYIDTRALTAFRTWSDSINGKVMFFSSAGSKTSHNELPVIGLSGVDDSYPPQKKSFMMLKYIHDHYIDDYEWFMRADDDVFIKGDQLEKFLRSVNSSKPQFIGQAGLGTKQEFGQLSLNGYDNFCMGGPGIVFSRETLRLIAKKIGYCLQNLYTTHEDVEVGRCVQQFAGIPCTWAFEVWQILSWIFGYFK